MMTFHRILCPVDFSDSSKRALRYALAVARWNESEITVLHVEDMSLRAAAVEAGGYPELAERHYQELYDFIDDAGGEKQNVRVHIAAGRAVSGILEHATREASDLIVMGTNGRSGLARAVLRRFRSRVAVMRQLAASRSRWCGGAACHSRGAVKASSREVQSAVRPFLSKRNVPFHMASAAVGEACRIA